MILLSSSFESFMQLLGALLIFVFVLVITYLTSRWIGGYQKIRMRNKNLQIVESLGVGQNKYVCLLKAGTEYLVVAVGKEEVTLLTKLAEEQLTDVPVFEESQTDSAFGKGSGAGNFQEVLEKVKERFPKK